MKKISAFVQLFTVNNFLKIMPQYIFAVSALTLLLPEGARFFSAAWVLIAEAYWLYARRVEQMRSVDLAKIEQQEMAFQALQAAYANLLDSLVLVDKDVLKKHGIHISIEKKRVVN